MKGADVWKHAKGVVSLPPTSPLKISRDQPQRKYLRSDYCGANTAEANPLGTAELAVSSEKVRLNQVEDVSFETVVGDTYPRVSYPGTGRNISYRICREANRVGLRGWEFAHSR